MRFPGHETVSIGNRVRVNEAWRVNSALIYSPDANNLNNFIAKLRPFTEDGGRKSKGNPGLPFYEGQK